MKLPLQLSERKTLLIVVDGALVLLATLLALVIWALRDGRFLPGPFVLSKLHWFPILTILWLALGFVNDAYDLRIAADRRASMAALARLAALEMAIYLLFYFFSPPQRELPRGIVLYQLVISCALVGAWRLTYPFLLSQAPFRRKAVVVGAGWAGRTIVQAVENNPGTGIELLGFIDDDPEKQNSENVPLVLGDRHKLPELIAERQISTLILAITHDIDAELQQILMDCLEKGVEVVPMPLLYEEITGKIPVQHIGSNWRLALPLDHAAARGFFPLIKRAMDISVSLVGLIILGLLFPFIALALIIDSPGPIFYTQERVGRGGVSYRLFKLRTMIPNAEREGRAIWAQERDPRVTRVGRLLRATHVDEFPQFFNILRGDMSVVGPRPERPEFVAELAEELPFYRLRHAVKPGMAGWGLVKQGYGSSREDALLKLQYDLYYIKHQSLWLDLVILLKTFADMATLGGRA